MKYDNRESDYLNQPIAVLKGIGEKMSQRFARRDLYTLQDLLFHLPLRYLDKTRIIPIATLRPGDSALISGKIIQCHTHFGKRAVLSCHLNDGSGTLVLRFFHFNKQQKERLRQGQQLRCFGDVRRGKNTLEITHPEYQLLDPDVILPVDETLTPVYPSTEGVSQFALRNALQQVLSHMQMSGEELLSDYIPQAILEQLKLPELSQALLYLHAPPADCPVYDLTQGSDPFRQRLVFEELLAHQLSMKQLHQQRQRYQSCTISVKRNLQTQPSAQFLSGLPFKLTRAQQRVNEDIINDLKKSSPMQRLVQGDVGSGKTVIAALAALYVLESGFQAALMAPTELLAEQHYNNFKNWFEGLGFSVGWLSGKLSAKQRKEILAQIEQGTVQMIVGTHALFQDAVKFQQLGLIVIDEQHRFGVHQRFALLQKGRHHMRDCYPHQLIMTATPIPRTLAMTAYADLDCSIIDELPPGRTPIDTVVISEYRRNEILARVHRACLQGRQAYWVCTLIEESESLQCQAAEETYELLQQKLPDVTIALLHGRMKSQQKQLLMERFKSGEVSLLVATTVIEVGVDVPAASLMIIENAERLGLSQLHQLRGRVGRGSQSSVCVLMYSSPLSKKGKSRLMTLRQTNDGFEVARKDLLLRGAGELLGTRQTGLAEMKIADIIKDQALLPQVNQVAEQIINDFPQAVEPLIQRWIAQGIDYQQV